LDCIANGSGIEQKGLTADNYLIDLSIQNEQKPPIIAGLLLIAPATDYTVELMEPGLNDDQKEQLKTKGFYVEKSEYFEEGNIWRREIFQVIFIH
jgi:hypothetical protein